MARTSVTFLGNLPVMSPLPDDGGSSLGESFAPPSGVRFEAGYGATEGDLRRGHLRFEPSGNPEYDAESYQNRATIPDQPRHENADFPYRNERSHGFLPRPRLPTER